MSLRRQLAWATLLMLPTAFGAVLGCDSPCSDLPRHAANANCSPGDKECLNPQPELPFCGGFSPQPSLPGNPSGGTASSGGEGGASSEGEGGASSEGEGGSSSAGGAAEGGAGSVTK